MWRVIIAAVLWSGASANAQNFTCQHQAYADRAEQCRQDLALFWFGQALPDWESPCHITVTNTTSNGGGATSFSFEGGGVHGWHMTVEGRPDRLLHAVIPHEVNHTVFATVVGRPIPRWLDEGLAGLVEDSQEHARLRRDYHRLHNHPCCVWRTIDSGQYPRDSEGISALYATGFGVCEWLLHIGGRDKLVQLAKHSLPPSQAIHAVYGMDRYAAEAAWRSWLAEHGDSCESAGCYFHAHSAHVVAKPPKVPGKPTLVAIGNDLCVACLPFKNAYTFDRNFRDALWARANVDLIDGMQYQQWAAGLGITHWPAYVLHVDGTSYVVATNFPGTGPLIAAIDRTLAMVSQPTGPPATPPPSNTSSEQDAIALLQEKVKAREAALAAREMQSASDVATAQRELLELQAQIKELSDTLSGGAAAASPMGEPIILNELPRDPAPHNHTPSLLPDRVWPHIPWGGILFGAAAAAGVGVPAWGVYAWRVSKLIAGRRSSTSTHQAGPAPEKEYHYHYAAPTVPEPPYTTPRPVEVSTGQRPSEQTEAGAEYRYPGSTPMPPTEIEHHYTVDAPATKTHRIDTRFVEVPVDRYQRAHEQARAEIARRYPGSQEVLGAELSLTKQFLAGQPPGTTH